MMRDLLTLAREFDLPPSWDGRTVEWSTWRSGPADGMFICPPPKRQDVCPGCGATEPYAVADGTVHPLPGETSTTPAQEREVVKRTRSGREYVKVVPTGPVTRPATPILRLMAHRCTVCAHDIVWDIVTDQWWDLDHTDYGPEGSRAP